MYLQRTERKAIEKILRNIALAARGLTMDGPEILTERLRLSRLKSGDAPAMFGYRSDPEVGRYQSFEPHTLGDVEAFIADLESNRFDTAGTWFQFAIRLRRSGPLIGDFGTRFSADPRQVEIGFTVAPDFQGRGYGTEAVVGVLDHLLGRLRKHRVYASVDPRNEACVALLKRVGMRQEAHFVKSVWCKGDWADDVVFGMLGSDWRDR